MKQLIVALFLLISICAAAQVKVTSKGLTFENGETYMVYEFTGMEKNDIYRKALIALSNQYVSPKNVISEVEGEQLTVNAISKNAIHRNKIHAFDVNYTLTFQFKDEKMKVDAPVVNSMTNWLDLKLQHLYIVGNQSIDGSTFGIYNKKEELRIDRAKADLEALFNRIINSVVEGINVKQDAW